MTAQNAGLPVRVLVIFPYILPRDDTERGQVIDVLHKLVEAVENREMGLHTSNRKPVMVVNKVTQRNVHFEASMAAVNPNREKWQFVESWSVDTCQDWLCGWGTMIDDWYNDSKNVQRRGHGKVPTAEGILQIPGDLRDVGKHGPVKSMQSFVASLRNMTNAVAAGSADFVIGGYDLIDQGGKYLIDNYATLPLLYNWFPEVAKAIREIPIGRPRSEFIAGRIEFFNTMLVTYRRFAYEQTTAFLINALAPENREKNESVPRICEIDLGQIQDHVGDRGFRESIDQLERMERMMRQLWRSLHGDNMLNLDEYGVLDERSASIRSAAMVTFRNFLAT